MVFIYLLDTMRFISVQFVILNQVGLVQPDLESVLNWQFKEESGFRFLRILYKKYFDWLWLISGFIWAGVNTPHGVNELSINFHLRIISSGKYTNEMEMKEEHYRVL